MSKEKTLGQILYGLSLGGLNMESPRFDHLASHIQSNWERTAILFAKHLGEPGVNPWESTTLQQEYLRGFECGRRHVDQNQLTTEERKAVDQLIEAHEEAFCHGLPPYCANELVAFFGRRFPKPAQRTPEELRKKVLADLNSDRGVSPDAATLKALDELVAQAKGKS